eukprot:m.51789 g.51789  ORF g.51789 m.51789 type:complete len:376 (-) comp9072_c0_seq3:53-1180(-)
MAASRACALQFVLRQQCASALRIHAHRTRTASPFAASTRSGLAVASRCGSVITCRRASGSLSTNSTHHDRDALAQWAHEVLFTAIPGGNLTFAAIYGSAAFAQLAEPSREPLEGAGTSTASTAKKGKMLDFILATDDPAAWHAENMQRNPEHYSTLARLAGPSRVAGLADRAGGVFYNTHVTVCGRLVKYGMASTATLVADLTHWDKFYLAGRLQKPVKVLVCSDEVREALEANLTAAVLHSVGKLPDTFDERSLYTTITGLSYAGDPRMVVGENRNKVSNIVDAQLSEFRALYKDHLAAAQLSAVDGVSGGLRRTTPTPLPTIISDDNLHKTVRSSSVAQMLLGILSAGPVKTVTYAAEKLGKWADGLRQTSAS